MQSILRIGIFCLLILTIVNIHEATYCPPNEVYNECDSACPPSCSDLFYPQETRFCTAQCISRCTCKPGLYRAKNGACVKPEQCCTGRNEEYTFCGTACPATCTYKPEICTLQCVSGCFCKRGYIRRDNSPNSPCILPSRCPY